MQYLATPLIFASLVVLLGSGCGDRTSRTHPIYYGKVIFGDSAAKKNVRQFMVQGQNVYLDENGNNKPDSDEMVNSGTVLKSENSEFQFQLATVDLGIHPDLVSESRSQTLILYVDIIGQEKYQMTGQLTMVTAASEPETIQFGGPLQFLQIEPLVLKPNSDQKQDLKIYLGTQPENAQSPTIVVPDKSPPFPTLAIEFQSTDNSNQSDSYLMDYFC